jgi:hypothetical protein
MKKLLFLGLLAAGVFAYSQRADLTRYLKMREM